MYFKFLINNGVKNPRKIRQLRQARSPRGLMRLHSMTLCGLLEMSLHILQTKSTKIEGKWYSRSEFARYLDSTERQQVVRVAWSVEASHVVQRSHERLSLIQKTVASKDQVLNSILKTVRM